MNRNRQLLAAVYSKTDGHCWYCGIHIEPFSNWEIDHQQPRSKGGVDDLWNLVPACRPCNSRKSNRDLGEYEELLVASTSNLIRQAIDLSRALQGSNMASFREKLEHSIDLLNEDALAFWGDGYMTYEECEAASQARRESTIEMPAAEGEM